MVLKLDSVGAWFGLLFFQLDNKDFTTGGTSASDLVFKAGSYEISSVIRDNCLSLL